MAADSLSLFQRTRKPQRDPLTIIGPKEQVEIPGPDRLDLPEASVTESLKPKTSRDYDLAPPYAPRRNETSKNHEKLIEPKDWLVGPAPGSPQNKDQEINKFFGLREHDYDQLEKTRNKNNSRAEWLTNPDQPKPTKLKQQPDRWSEEADEEEKPAGRTQRDEDRFGPVSRQEKSFTSVFDARPSERREARAPAGFGYDSASAMKELLGFGGFGANSLKDREAEARRQEFRQWLAPTPPTSPAGSGDALAMRLDAPRPAPPVGSTVPELDVSGRAPRIAAFDPAEYSGQAVRFRAPLSGDLNKRQFGASDAASDTKPKTEPPLKWAQPTVLPIPKRKF